MLVHFISVYAFVEPENCLVSPAVLVKLQGDTLHVGATQVLMAPSRIISDCEEINDAQGVDRSYKRSRRILSCF